MNIEDFKTIIGIPFEEALKVLTIYKETKLQPTKDYVDGYEAGWAEASRVAIFNLERAIGEIFED